MLVHVASSDGEKLVSFGMGFHVKVSNILVIHVFKKL